MWRTSMLFVALLIGCSGDDGTDNGTQPNVLGATLVAQTGFAGVTGTASLDWTTGAQEFTADVTLAGDQPGAVRVWHVHFGNCNSNGAIVGEPSSYPPLAIGSDGRAGATGIIDFELAPAAAYYVNVHASEADQLTIVACGELARPGTPGGGGGGGNDDDGYPY